MDSLTKLQWACRRGMLELDIILQDFLSQVYPSLSLAEQKKFVALLSCSDAELADWLLSGKSIKKEFKKIVGCILNHAHSHI